LRIQIKPLGLASQVISVEFGSPAETAGIVAGDVLYRGLYPYEAIHSDLFEELEREKRPTLLYVIKNEVPKLMKFESQHDDDIPREVTITQSDECSLKPNTLSIDSLKFVSEQNKLEVSPKIDEQTIGFGQHIRSGFWESEEVARLNEAILRYGKNNVALLVKAVGTRTRAQIKRRLSYLHEQNKDEALDINHEAMSQIVNQRRTGRWGRDEIERLNKGITEHGKQNAAILAEIVGTRDSTQIRRFFRYQDSANMNDALLHDPIDLAAEVEEHVDERCLQNLVKGDEMVESFEGNPKSHLQKYWGPQDHHNLPPQYQQCMHYGYQYGMHQHPPLPYGGNIWTHHSQLKGSYSPYPYHSVHMPYAPPPSYAHNHVLSSHVSCSNRTHTALEQPLIQNSVSSIEKKPFTKKKRSRTGCNIINEGKDLHYLVDDSHTEASKTENVLCLGGSKESDDEYAPISLGTSKPVSVANEGYDDNVCREVSPSSTKTSFEIPVDDHSSFLLDQIAKSGLLIQEKDQLMSTLGNGAPIPALSSDIAKDISTQNRCVLHIVDPNTKKRSLDIKTDLSDSRRQRSKPLVGRCPLIH
jgi:hypothetical protein